MMNFEQKRFGENEKPQKKLTQKEEYNNIEIKNKEKIYFENVFRDLCALEKETSSEDTKERKYQKKKVKKKVKKKSTLNKKTSEEVKKTTSPPKTNKKYQEDINLDSDSSLTNKNFYFLKKLKISSKAKKGQIFTNF